MIFHPANNIEPKRFCELETEVKKLRYDTEYMVRDYKS